MRTSSSKKKTVCVLGPRLLQNRLVALHLEDMTGTKCLAARTPDEARSLLGRKFEGLDLILWDGEEKDLVAVLKGLGDGRGQMPAKSLLALFNVGSMSLRGRKVSDSRIKGVFLEGDSVEEIATGVSEYPGWEALHPHRCKASSPGQMGVQRP